MIKSKFMTMVISPMLQGMNILITHGTLEIGEVPKSALQERAMPSVMVKIPTRNMQQRCGKYCLCKLRTPLKNKRRLCTAVIVVQERIYIIPFLYEMHNTACQRVQSLCFSAVDVVQ